MEDDFIENPHVQNMVTVGKINIPGIFEQLLELDEVESPGEYFPSRLRIVLEKHSICLFKSGKYVIYGCKSMREIEDAVDEFRRFLMEVGILKHDQY